MRKTIIVLLVVFLLAGGLVFAGGQKEAMQEGESKKPEVSVSERVHGGEANIDWRRFEGETLDLLFVAHPWQEAIEPHLEEFEQLTGMKTSLNVLSEDLFWEKLVTGLMGGNTPFDVTFLGAGYDTMSYYKNGWLEPLDGYINDNSLTDKDWYDIEDINNKYRQNFMLPDLEGKLYGLPITSEVYIIWYRKDVFDQLGIDANQLKNMNDWLEVTKRINEETDLYGASIRGGSIGIKDEITAMVHGFWGDEPYIFGRDMYFDENWCPRFTDPRIIEAVSTWAEVMKYAPPGVTAYTWYDAVTAFQQGLTGTYWYDASLFSPSFEDPEQSNIAGKVGYAVVPETDYGHKTSYWSWGLGIPANAKDKEAAWLFIEWATSKYGDATTAPNTWGATRESTWNDPEYTRTLPQDYVEAVNASMKIVEPSLLYLTTAEEITKALLVALHDIYGGKSADDSMSDLQEEAKDILIQAGIIEKGQCD